jgi:hypothetical protein
MATGTASLTIPAAIYLPGAVMAVQCMGYRSMHSSYTFSFSLIAPPLSVDSVMAVLAGVTEMWRKIGRELYIGVAALDIIGSDFTSDVDKLRAVVRYWLMRDPYASWRRLIWRLEWSTDSRLGKVADRIRNRAERLTGMKLCELIWSWVCGLLVPGGGCALSVHEGCGLLVPGGGCACLCMRGVSAWWWCA